MKKKHGVVLVVMAFAMTGAFLFAQEEGTGGKVGVTLDFNASVLSVDTDGNVESMTDAGFGDGSDSTLSASYNTEWFGGTVSIGFGEILAQLFNGEHKPNASMLSIQELYAWVKPFGEHFKFTAGIFENTDGVNDYTDDIDNFGMGVFYDGSEGNGFYAEPAWPTLAALENGLLSEATFGPVTAQFLFAPNFARKTASAAFGDFMGSYAGPSYTPLDKAGARLYRLGARLIGTFPDIVTLSAMFKMESYPMDEMNNFMTEMWPLMQAEDPSLGPYEEYPGSEMAMVSFGAYADITAIENLGVSLGYTGFMLTNDDSDAKILLYSGIDLRATWTGIEGLSVSTHNNVSFGQGDDWYLGKDNKFLALYNALGATKELTEQFSINGEVGNMYARTDRGGSKIAESEEFWGQIKLISRLVENTEFTVGLRVDYSKTEAGSSDESNTVFSIPVGVKVSF